jgi:hypothetical protein
MRFQELQELIKQGEGPALEFKTSDILSDPFAFAREIVAIANTMGGRILIGVRNDGSLEGMEQKVGHDIHVANIARDKCEPPINVQFESVAFDIGTVYVTTIPRAIDFPHGLKTKDGKVYPIRVASSVRDASVQELSFLFSKVTVDMLDRFRGDQERRLLQDKLEKLYSPIMNNLDHINNAPFDFRHPLYPEYAEFFRGVRANVYLASPEFRPFLEDFLATIDGRRSRELLGQARSQMLEKCREDYERYLSELDSLMP